METSREKVLEWLNRDFRTVGGFLTSSHDETVLLAKGGGFEWVSEISSAKNAFFLKSFYNQSYLRYVPESLIKVKVTVLKDALESFSLDSSFEKESVEDATYAEDFRSLKQTFGKDLKKVVLISRASFKAKEESNPLYFMKKAFSFGAGMPYGLWNPEYGVTGSTPELLFSIRDTKIFTYALAGTSKKGEEKNLLASMKDREEHDLVIQDIQEKLSSFTQSLTIQETTTFPYKSMVHLKTDIEGEIIPSCNLTNLLNTLSPTAALGGYPTKAALSFLASTRYAQKFKDRFFGSAIGAVFENDVEFLVSIRNVQWSINEVFIESGGGVLPESDLEKELREIFLKREAIEKHYL